MKSIPSKNIKPTNSNHPPFFQKESNNNFFGKSNNPFFNSTSVQAKLTVDQPDTPAEQEADTMADKVVQISDKSFSTSDNNPTPVLQNSNSVVQRNCKECEKEQKLQKKEKGDEKDIFKNELQTKPIFESNAEPPEEEKNIQRKCAACEHDGNEKIQKKETNDLADKGTESPQSVPAISPVTARFIVDYNVSPATGQMRKTDFLNRLKEEICITVDQALAGTAFSSDNCPYIKAAFARHQNSNPLQLEQLIARYEPSISQAQSVDDLIQRMKVRVYAAAKQWVRTGGDLSGTTQIFGGSVSGIDSAISGIVSGIGSLFFKASNGGVKGIQSPQAVMQSLGKGSPMESGSRGKMEGAFGTSFSGVKIHSDSTAARLSQDMNARAFTVGNHIAFASGEHNPGTLVGDALMAHELAHVQQQSGINNSDNSSYDLLEKDADETALGIMTKTMTGKDISSLKKKSKGLKTGLSLSRCGSSEPSNQLNLKNLTPDQLKQYKKTFIAKNFQKKDRDFASKILEDMFESNELSFRDESALKTEISKRMDASRRMQESQNLYGKAFEYPNHPLAKACLPDNKDGKKDNPRVNEKAKNYWGPVQNPQGNYYFDLSPYGKEHGYEALKLLFSPQPGPKAKAICNMTLIHCDYLASVVHLLVYADSIGEEQFNARVKSGDLKMRLTYYGFKELEESEHSSVREVRPASEKDLVIGDHVIFWNHRAYDLLTAGSHDVWRLENAFLINKKKNVDQFEGHGSGIKTNVQMREKLAEKFNSVVDKARKLIGNTKSRDLTDSAKANAEMSSKFPNVKNVAGKWSLQGTDHSKTFDINLEQDEAHIKPSDPDLTGLRDPEDPSKMNCVKRPAESPGESC